MNRMRKLELVQRSLGIKHKLKVLESLKVPNTPEDTHEELAKIMLARWEFEDELQAIDEILKNTRLHHVEEKKHQLLKSTSKAEDQAIRDAGHKEDTAKIFKEWN